MLTVAPNGKVKLAVPLETPACFSTVSMVTGKVADDDAVEKAVSKTGDIVLFTTFHDSQSASESRGKMAFLRCFGYS